MKFAVNFHAYGNYFVTPFNADPLGNTRLEEFFSEANTIYNDLGSYFPQGVIQGNGLATVEYSANGEGSDWFLGHASVLSMSPELGTNNEETRSFFLPTVDLIKEVVEANSVFITHLMELFNSSAW